MYKKTPQLDAKTFDKGKLTFSTKLQGGKLKLM